MIKTIDTSVLLSQGLSVFWDWLIVRGMRDETLRGYRVDINQFQKWLTARSNGPVFVSEIQLEHLESFVEYLVHERECKPRTINRKINALSTFFNCMKKKKYVTENPLE